MSGDGAGEDDEEDWFEAALREDDATDGADQSGAGEEPAEAGEADDEGEGAAAWDEFGAAEETSGAEPAEEEPWAGSEGAAAADADPAAGAGADAEPAEADWTEAAGGADPFGGGGEPGADEPAGSAGGADEEPAWASGASDPFGGDGADDGGAFGGGGFDDDFGDAFESAGGDDDFEDEDFSSDIPRIDLGISGLDDMIQGGVPKRHLLVCIGGAGSGKTTFGMQFLQHGLQNGQNGVFITLEQSHESIMDTATDRGWEFDRYEDEDKLAVVDLDPVEMANSLDNIQGELPGLIEQFGADRLVLDSVSLLEMMYEDQARRRTEVFDFTRSLKQAGVTTFLTSEASHETDYASRYGTIEYLTDGVFYLQYVRAETRETRLALEIQKIRNANHSRETKPYEITMDGISVYHQANIF